MATIHLRNLTGRALRRTSLLGGGYLIEPPEIVARDDTVSWTTTDSGTVGYRLAAPDEAAADPPHPSERGG
jgi:hypothetical protein